MMSPLELLKFVEATVEGSGQQLNALALLADAPDEKYMASIRLPVQNEIPAFHLGGNGLGSDLADIDYGQAAPVPGQARATEELSIGELLIGETNAI